MLFTEYRPTPTKGVGFWGQIGIPSRGRKLHEALHDGIAYGVYPKLAKASGIEPKALARYVNIASATLGRRAQSKRFTCDESDRLYRFAELFKTALDLFEGDHARAREWVLKSNPGLGGRAPVEMIKTSAEHRTVLNLIGRLEHGVMA
ncbi:antitoxin Xre/MbcA/ParS toxin-binding domain-containing protein [uncultured Kushneria sp.]|uniref:type II RES/Xre toxin-antitoxin system antitoxin n=1 Tax=uncultured Kushneria sp. TaxID=905033 RepID=UPI00260E15B6|nr:antitoxin Xre/MbcA/ParS toxin-binding domain-containing protein [uncultured Kushneria sp.]